MHHIKDKLDRDARLTKAELFALASMMIRTMVGPRWKSVKYMEEKFGRHSASTFKLDRDARLSLLQESATSLQP